MSSSSDSSSSSSDEDEEQERIDLEAVEKMEREYQESLQKALEKKIADEQAAKSNQNVLVQKEDEQHENKQQQESPKQNEPVQTEDEQQKNKQQQETPKAQESPKQDVSKLIPTAENDTGKEVPVQDVSKQTPQSLPTGDDVMDPNIPIVDNSWNLEALTRQHTLNIGRLTKMHNAELRDERTNSMQREAACQFQKKQLLRAHRNDQALLQQTARKLQDTALRLRRAEVLLDLVHRQLYGSELEDEALEEAYDNYNRDYGRRSHKQPPRESSPTMEDYARMEEEFDERVAKDARDNASPKHGESPKRSDGESPKTAKRKGDDDEDDDEDDDDDDEDGDPHRDAQNIAQQTGVPFKVVSHKSTMDRKTFKFNLTPKTQGRTPAPKKIKSGPAGSAVPVNVPSPPEQRKDTPTAMDTGMGDAEDDDRSYIDEPSDQEDFSDAGGEDEQFVPMQDFPPPAWALSPSARSSGSGGGSLKLKPWDPNKPYDFSFADSPEKEELVANASPGKEKPVEEPVKQHEEDQQVEKPAEQSPVIPMDVEGGNAQHHGNEQQHDDDLFEEGPAQGGAEGKRAPLWRSRNPSVTINERCIDRAGDDAAKTFDYRDDKKNTLWCVLCKASIEEKPSAMGRHIRHAHPGLNVYFPSNTRRWETYLRFYRPTEEDRIADRLPEAIVHDIKLMYDEFELPPFEGGHPYAEFMAQIENVNHDWLAGNPGVPYVRGDVYRNKYSDDLKRNNEARLKINRKLFDESLKQDERKMNRVVEKHYRKMEKLKARMQFKDPKADEKKAKSAAAARKRAAKKRNANKETELEDDAEQEDEQIEQQGEQQEQQEKQEEDEQETPKGKQNKGNNKRKTQLKVTPEKKTPKRQQPKQKPKPKAKTAPKGKPDDESPGPSTRRARRGGKIPPLPQRRRAANKPDDPPNPDDDDVFEPEKEKEKEDEDYSEFFKDPDAGK